MKFWRENKLDMEFEMPVTEVADRFVVHYEREHLHEAPFPLERMLRGWMTARDGLNSSWEAEHGKESFDALFSLLRGMIYGHGCPECGGDVCIGTDGMLVLHMRYQDALPGLSPAARPPTVPCEGSGCKPGG